MVAARLGLALTRWPQWALWVLGSAGARYPLARPRFIWCLDCLKSTGRTHKFEPPSPRRSAKQQRTTAMPKLQDDEIIRGGERVTVPLVMMDALQQAIAADPERKSIVLDAQAGRCRSNGSVRPASKPSAKRLSGWPSQPLRIPIGGRLRRAPNGCARRGRDRGYQLVVLTFSSSSFKPVFPKRFEQLVNAVPNRLL
jgi:hypothetical protein